MTERDAFFMREAIVEAEKAKKKDEVPVGAVVVFGDKIIARGHNLRERKQDCTLHAEMIALKRACKKLRSWRLTDCTLYVTLEPCPMCAGAAMNARLDRLVFGASDPKADAGLYNIYTDKRLNHTLPVEGGVLKEECAGILTAYFKEHRRK